MAGKSKKEVLEIMDEVLDGIKLTEKEKEFVLRYVSSYNATQSVMHVYGYDKYVASVYGNKLLKRNNVISAIKKLKKIQKRVYDIDPNEYLEYLLKVARADVSDYIKFGEEEVPVLDSDGSQMVNPDTGEPLTKTVNKMHLSDSNNVDCDVITSIKQGRDGISINLADKMAAWEKLRQYFGWGEKQNEKVDNTDSIIKAIQGKTEEVWDDEAIEGVEDELDEALKDG